MNPLIADAQKTDFKAIVQILNAGGVLIFPTETLYGLGCDATNVRALLKIYQIKNRPLGKSFPLLVRDWKMLNEYASINTHQKKTISGWKQPTNFVVKAKNLSPLVMENRTAAFRFSKGKWIKKLFKQFDRPMVATSANLAGQPPVSDPRTYKEVFGKKADLIDAVIFDGLNKKKKGSRIVDLIKRPYHIIRA